MPTKWEYRLVNLDFDAFAATSEQKLNKAGLQGWEAVGLSDADAETTILLKRPLSD